MWQNPIPKKSKRQGWEAAGTGNRSGGPTVRSPGYTTLHCTKMMLSLVQRGRCVSRVVACGGGPRRRLWGLTCFLLRYLLLLLGITVPSTRLLRLLQFPFLSFLSSLLGTMLLLFLLFHLYVPLPVTLTFVCYNILFAHCLRCFSSKQPFTTLSRTKAGSVLQ